MNNKLASRQRRYKSLIKNLAVAYDTKSNQSADIVNYKLGIFAKLSQNVFNAFFINENRWTVILIAIGVDKDGNKAFSAMDIETVNYIKQADMAEYIKPKLEKFKSSKHQNLKEVSNSAWLAMPQRVDLEDGEIIKSLKLIGAW